VAASDASPLEDLAGQANREFPRLFAARKRTKEGLAERSDRIAGLPHDKDAAVVLMGSWGRGEVTKASDDDFMLLVHGTERAGSDVEPSVEQQLH
jgi:UTP:GlnB (protein PII) uridylyltransferase